MVSKSRLTQVREAIREAVRDEPLWLRIAAYRLHSALGDASLEKLWRLLR